MCLNTKPILYVGVDVAKQELEVFLAGRAFQTPNTTARCQRLLQLWQCNMVLAWRC